MKYPSVNKKALSGNPNESLDLIHFSMFQQIPQSGQWGGRKQDKG